MSRIISFLEILGARQIPLFWLRLPLWIATVGLSVVCVAVGAQALRRLSENNRDLTGSNYTIGVRNYKTVFIAWRDTTM